MTTLIEFAAACGVVAGWALVVYGGTYLIGAAVDRWMLRQPPACPQWPDPCDACECSRVERAKR